MSLKQRYIFLIIGFVFVPSFILIVLSNYLMNNPEYQEAGIFIFSAVTLVIACVMFIIINRITEKDIFGRINSLNQYISEVLKGKQKIGESLPKVKDDEIGQLFESINRLSFDLKKYEYLLETERDKLKEQVEKQTRDLEERFEELKNLHKVANALSREENEQAVYKNTLEAAEEILGYNYSFISILEEDKLNIKLISDQFECDDKNSLMKYLEEKARESFSLGETKIYYFSSTNLLHNKYKALISTPLENIGVFQILSLQKRVFSENQLYLVELTASYAGGAIKRIRMEKSLWEQAVKDSLTGLYNRNFFNEVIVNEIHRSERTQKTFALIMVDVNRFKEVNDRYGHMTGDLILKEVAQLLKETLRKNDWVVRFGGDEFLIVLPNCKDTIAVKNKIEDAVMEWNQNNDLLDFNLTLAVGIASFLPGRNKKIEEVLKIADEKMYIDKELKYKSEFNSRY